MKRLFPFVLLIAALAGNLPGAELTNTAPRPRPPTQPVSPEIHADRTVTFRLRAPNATNVTVSGEWGGRATSMAKDGDGIWSATVGPLEPELYGYSFHLDGFQMLDPGNAAVKPMRSPRTSMLEVPGQPPLLHEFNASIPHGTVRQHWYQSKSTGTRRSLHVYTPPGYERSRRNLPVLYLLHGNGDNDATWTALGRAQVILDNLLAQGRVKQMIVVMTDGHPYVPPLGASPTNVEVRARSVKAYQEDLVQDVMPFVEANYRTINKRESRAIVGLSMGGGQSLAAGLNHLDRFAWVGAMSASVPDGSAVPAAINDVANTNRKLKLFWMAIGKDDFLLERNERFHQLLETSGIRHTYKVTDGNHSWPVWRKYLAEFAPLLFQKTK